MKRYLIIAIDILLIAGCAQQYMSEVVISDGEGIKGIVVGESTIEDVEKVFGKPNSIKQAGKRAKNYFYKGIQFNIYEKDVGGKLNTVCFSKPFSGCTKRGIHVGSDENDIRAAYGKPSYYGKAGKYFVISYNDDGILFWMFKEKVRTVVVFKKCSLVNKKNYNEDETQNKN